MATETRRDTEKVGSGNWFFPEGVTIRGASFRPGTVIRNMSDEEAERLQKGNPVLLGEPTTPVKMEKWQTPWDNPEARTKARQKYIVDMANAQADAIKQAATGERPKSQYPDGPSMDEIVAKRKEIREKMDEAEANRASMPTVALVAAAPAHREAPSVKKG